MTGRNRGAILLALFLLLLAGCAAPHAGGARGDRYSLPWELPSSQPRLTWEKLYEIRLTEPVGKACYDQLHDTLYLLHPQSNTVSVYVGGKRVNTLGGLGYGDTQFSRLSDIALGPDGRLLALDSFRAQIKRFDFNGDLVSSVKLDGLTDPRLLASTNGGNLFIWDAARRDITIFADPPAEQPYTFGRFLVEQPELMTSNSGWLYVWDGDATVFFNQMGGFKEEQKRRYHLSNNGMALFLDRGVVRQYSHPDTPLALAPHAWRNFWIKNNFMMLAGDNVLWLGRFGYETETH